MTPLLEQLQVVLRPKIADHVQDGELIERFLNEQDSFAFGELVRRHGPMVFGVCRRILQHHHDAEDAFQAVFLVFANKADSVWPRENLAAWLYGVACRTALKARIRIRKRQAVETSTEMPCALVHDNTVADADWRRVLDEEVQRLPETLRLPIVLCGLQGKTRQVVSRELGCPEGTVAGRFHRAKQMLAERLAKRGFPMSLATVAGWLATPSTQAAMPVALLASTTKLAELCHLEAVTSALVPETVQSLSEGVMTTMTMSKWKTLAISLCFLMMSMGLSYVGFAVASGDPDAAKPGQPPHGGQPDHEPIRPELVLEKEIQKELRLSENQVNKLKAAWEAGTEQAKDENAQAKEIDKQLEDLQKRIEELSAKRSKLVSTVQEKQSQSLKSAIHAHLSERALRRLREITLRQMSLHETLLSPQMQAALNINDEQYKKLKEIQPRGYHMLNSVIIQDLDTLVTAPKFSFWMGLDRQEDAANRLVWTYSGVDREAVLKILTPEQRKKWEAMLGEPYPRPSLGSEEQGKQ